jgi:sortase A
MIKPPQLGHGIKWRWLAGSPQDSTAIRRIPKKVAPLMRWCSSALLILSAILLGYWAIVTLDRWRYQRAAESDFRLMENAAAASVDRGGRPIPTEAAKSRALISSGKPFGRVEIPRLGIGVAISQGIDSRTLRRTVGHIPTTPFPGEAGNIGLAGHRDSFFRNLKDAQVGDSIRVTTPDGVFEYQIDSLLIVAPDRLDVLRSTQRPELTLVTCYPFYYVGRAPKRFIVRAVQVERRPSS